VTWKIKEARRSRTSSKPDSTITVYMGMEGRLPLGELLDYLSEHHPHIDPRLVELNYATAKWEEPATDEDRAKWEAHRLDSVRRREAWELKTYEELRAKYGPS
jgi:hypothetical protein